MKDRDRFTRLEFLRPRDLDVVRVLIERADLDERNAADEIGMSVHTLKSRLKHIYPLLGVANRLELFARYHAVIAPCRCVDASLERGRRESESTGVPEERIAVGMANTQERAS